MKFLTKAEVAKTLSVSDITVHRLINKGEIQILKVGRAVRISEESLKEYIDQNMSGTSKKSIEEDINEVWDDEEHPPKRRFSLQGIIKGGDPIPEEAIDEVINDPVLAEIKQRLNETLGDNVERIILFGSRARGDAHKDSDYDVLLLVKKRSRELENQVNDIAYDMLDRYGKLVNIFDSEVAVYEKSKIDPLFLNIRREGVVL
jgi:excisionase family DNA binding protein